MDVPRAAELSAARGTSLTASGYDVIDHIVRCELWRVRGLPFPGGRRVCFPLAVSCDALRGDARLGCDRPSPPELFGATLGFGIVAFLVLAGEALRIRGWFARGLADPRAWAPPVTGAHGRWFHLTPSRLDAAERWFDRYGDLAVLIGRVTPLIRSFISIPAGVFSVPLVRYLSLTLVGSAIWSFAFAGAGWGLGSGYSRIHNTFQWSRSPSSYLPFPASPADSPASAT